MVAFQLLRTETAIQLGDAIKVCRSYICDERIRTRSILAGIKFFLDAYEAVDCSEVPEPLPAKILVGGVVVIGLHAPSRG